MSEEGLQNEPHEVNARLFTMFDIVNVGLQ